MADTKNNQRWTVNKEVLKDLSPINIRNLIVECLFEAQKEMLIDSIPDKVVDLSVIKEAVENIIQAGFKETGGDFINPTQDQLLPVIKYLANKSATWGTSKEIVDYHFNQMKKIIDHLSN